MLQTYLLTCLTKIFRSSLSSITLSSYPLLTTRLSSLPHIKTILFVLKSSTIFRINSMSELTVSESPKKIHRFNLKVFLLSIEYNFRLVLNCPISTASFIPTLSTVYINSCWSEREVRDMFGMYFLNNLDLRRLLTDYGFEGFPLRKDFPLTGYYEVRYDDELQQILYEPVQLSQEFRIFQLSSPWEKKQ